MLKLIVAMMLAHLCVCLHLESTNDEEYYNADNYLSDLNKRQEKFKADVDSIRAQIQQINLTLNSSTLTPNERLTALSEGLADERDSLYNIETYLYQPFEIEPCRQVNLSSEQRNTLQQQIDVVNASLQNLSKEVDFCPECPQIKQIKAQVLKEFNYLQVIEATVHSNCLPVAFEFEEENATGLVNLANSMYKDNLKAENWRWGNITE